MVGRQKYDDACAVALALEIVGERWSLLIVRELILGPKRFSDLRAALPGASADIISQRLQGLAAREVVRRRRLPPPAGADVYELTAWGAQLDSVVMSLAAWAHQSAAMEERRNSPISLDSELLSLRVRFDPTAARGLSVRLQLTVDGVPVAVLIESGTLRVQRRSDPVERPDVTLTMSRDSLHDLLDGLSDLQAEVDAGRALVVGDRELARRAVQTFTTAPAKSS